MAQNEEIALSLQPLPVPADLQCLSNVKTLEELLERVAQYIAVVGSGGTQPGQVFPSAVVLATSAKATADAALQAVDALAARVPQQRFSSGPIAVSTGDSTVSLTWEPPMPSVEYDVNVTFEGASGHPAAYYGYRVVSDSKTANGCTVSIDNAPANTKITWVVTELIAPAA